MTRDLTATPPPMLATPEHVEHLQRDLAARDVEVARLRAAMDANAAAWKQSQAEVARLSEELGHATAAEGDWLSKTSRLMCETVLGERDALRGEVERLSEELDRTASRYVNLLACVELSIATTEAECDSLRARLALVEPVVEAAKRWRQCDEAPLQAEPGKLVVTKICNHDDLADAIDTLLAAEKESQ